VKIRCGILIGLLLFCSQCFAYTDISSSHWAFSDLTVLTEQGIVSGYPDGTFRPNQQISKAEFLSLLQRSLFPNADVSGVFGEWYDGSYQFLMEENLVNSYAFSKDNLQDVVRRFEVGEAFVYCFPKAKQCFLKDEYDGKALFSDTVGERERKLAAILTETGIFKGYPDNTIRLKGTVTRAEMVCMISNLLKNRNLLENFVFQSEERIYEDNYAISSDLQMYCELQPLQYAEDERVVITKLNHIELVEALENVPEKYREIFMKLEDDIPYYQLRKSYLEGNKVIIVEFETINRSEKYSTLTGADFLHLNFPGREDVKVIDVFDTNDFQYVDNQVPIQNFEVMPQSVHKTVAVYVVNDFSNKIRFHRNVNTMYSENEYIHTSSIQALTVYL